MCIILATKQKRAKELVKGNDVDPVNNNIDNKRRADDRHIY
jgi:hypothetical protein